LDDPRTQPLLQILRILPSAPNVRYLLLENVKGFESSEAREKMMAVLDDLQFDRREFLLTPGV